MYNVHALYSLKIYLERFLSNIAIRFRLLQGRSGAFEYAHSSLGDFNRCFQHSEDMRFTAVACVAPYAAHNIDGPDDGFSDGMLGPYVLCEVTHK